jgi:hypothetical protein
MFYFIRYVVYEQNSFIYTKIVLILGPSLTISFLTLPFPLPDHTSNGDKLLYEA